MVKLTEIYSLREIAVNPNHVVFAKDSETLNSKSKISQLVEGLNRDVSFTQVGITAGSGQRIINVVGSLQQILEKIYLELRYEICSIC